MDKEWKNDVDKMQELLKTRDKFFECIDNPSDKHCLMFIEGDLEASWNTTKEKINERVSSAEKALKQTITTHIKTAEEFKATFKAEENK